MGEFDPSRREIYTPEQVQLYYERIELPRQYRKEHISCFTTFQEKLDFLTRLQKYQLVAVPFENLSLHYSPHHTITIEPRAVFEKIVVAGSGRGGYCMENNTLFGTVLRSVGFEVVSIAARVNEAIEPISAYKGWQGPKYDGWNHMLNIVKLDGQKFIAETGNGSTGTIRPFPLTHTQISNNIRSQEIRLVYGNIPDLTSQGDKLWEYQHRNDPSQPWIPTYCFSEMEFTPNDYQMMNYFTSTHRTSWFTRLIVCVKMIMEDGEIVGNVTLNGNEVKRRIEGKSEVLAVLSSETERVKALEEYFGIQLTTAEKEGIRGMVTELL